MGGPTMSRPASEVYSDKQLKHLLAMAEMHAVKDWDRNFITDMLSRFKHYGMGMHISALQKHHLERVANLTANERARNGTTG